MEAPVYARVHFRGDSIAVDHMNHTDVSINEQLVELRPDSTGTDIFDRAGYIDVPQLEVGDFIDLELPSGTLSFMVEEVHDREEIGGQVVSGRGGWEGSYGGLCGGVSGLAWFEAEIIGDVKTSAWHEPVPPQIYKAAHLVADAIREQLRVDDPEFKRGLMRWLLGSPNLLLALQEQGWAKLAAALVWMPRLDHVLDEALKEATVAG